MRIDNVIHMGLFSHKGAMVLLLLMAIWGLWYWLRPRPVDFFECYSEDPQVVQLLRKFYSHPVRKLRVDGVEWIYYVNGQGRQTVVFLHGMGGAYDIWWQQLLHFQSTYRVLSYTLPAEVSSLKGVARGIQAVLDEEGVDSVVLVGTSMGGYIAQYLMTRMPERIHGVVIAHSFPPNSLIARQNKLFATIMPWLPASAIALYGKYIYTRKVFPAGGNEPLLRCFLLSIPFDKRSFIHRYRIIVERFPLDAEAYRHIPKLLLESTNDPLIPEELRLALRKLYPEARHYNFGAKGHFPYLHAAGEYNRVLYRFLEDLSSRRE